MPTFDLEEGKGDGRQDDALFDEGQLADTVRVSARPRRSQNRPYVSKEYSGDYRYRADFTIETKQPVRAFEVACQIVDVYGNHVRGLRYSHVGDLDAGASKKVEGQWQLSSENEAEAHYASIAYISRVRLADGRVIVANLDPVVAEAKKFSAKFTVEDINPPKTNSAGR